MARKKDANWNVADSESGAAKTVYHAQLAVLMDLRDELKQLNGILGCHNVAGGMIALQRLDRRAAKHWPLTGRRKK